MHRHIKQILSKQEQAHLDSVNSFLQRKEGELKLVTGELAYRASQDDYKDLLISKLQQIIGKIDKEGHQVLDQCKKSSKEISVLRQEIDGLKKDRVLLFSKCKESGRTVKEL